MVGSSAQDRPWPPITMAAALTARMGEQRKCRRQSPLREQRCGGKGSVIEILLALAP